MLIFYVLYFGLLIGTNVMAYLSYKKGNKKYLFILLMSFMALLSEVTFVPLSHYSQKGYAFIYFIYNLIEYSLLAMYYVKACQNNRYKFTAKLSIFFFAVFWFYVSFFIYKLHKLPALNIAVEGFLLFIAYSHLLFKIDADVNLFIYNHPDFWIATGIMIFFGGIFVFFVFYTPLAHLDRKQTSELYKIITEPLNLILYTCTIIGLTCSIRYQKYLTQ